jgi:type I restriction-modification system DNA methylase subunit
MNMLLHGAKGADIRKGDTIREPKHIENGVLKTYDKVLANPPFSLKIGDVKKQVLMNLIDFHMDYHQNHMEI